MYHVAIVHHAPGTCSLHASGRWRGGLRRRMSPKRARGGTALQCAAEAEGDADAAPVGEGRREWVGFWPAVMVPSMESAARCIAAMSDDKQWVIRSRRWTECIVSKMRCRGRRHSNTLRARRYSRVSGSEILCNVGQLDGVRGMAEWCAWDGGWCAWDGGFVGLRRADDTRKVMGKGMGRRAESGGVQCGSWALVCGWWVGRANRMDAHIDG